MVRSGCELRGIKRCRIQVMANNWMSSMRMIGQRCIQSGHGDQSDQSGQLIAIIHPNGQKSNKINTIASIPHWSKALQVWISKIISFSSHFEIQTNRFALNSITVTVCTESDCLVYFSTISENTHRKNQNHHRIHTKRVYPSSSSSWPSSSSSSSAVHCTTSMLSVCHINLSIDDTCWIYMTIWRRLSARLISKWRVPHWCGSLFEYSGVGNTFGEKSTGDVDDVEGSWVIRWTMGKCDHILVAVINDPFGSSAVVATTLVTASPFAVQSSGQKLKTAENLAYPELSSD